MSREVHVRFCESRGVRFPPATHLVILVHGQRSDVETLREDLARVLTPLGLRLSPAKTQVVHMSEGFDFLGFRIQWKRKPGTSQWYVYTFIADRPLKAVKAKIRAMTHRVSQANPRTILTRINQMLRGWAALLPARRMQAHPQQPEALRRMAGHQVAEETPPLALEAVPAAVHHPLRAVATAVDGRDRVVQPRIGGSNSIPLPGRDPRSLGEGKPRLTAGTAESPVRREAHAGFGERHGETDRQQCRHRAPCRLNHRLVHRFRPFPVGSRLMTARYRHFIAACSLGKWPRAFTALRSRALIDSMALVVHTTFLISRSNCRNGTNSGQAFSQSRMIAG
jgi:hypothetical protein